jgi:osmoprotectant transport system ATP-binding protein
MLVSALTLHGVAKVFVDTPVLRDLSLEFAAGSLSAVIGPSGCGKSTLLKLCLGLLRPDRGEIRLFGEPLDYQRLPALRRRLGYAVQGTGLFPHLTARQNITLMAELEGWQRAAIDTRLEELLALSQLEAALLSRYPHQLSGGQQQRVGLCRALMLRPEILLLDEPFAAIDPITRAEVHAQLLAVLRAEPRTMILVTHDLREALQLCERIVVLRNGHVMRVASREELLDDRGDAASDQRLADLVRGSD